MDDRAPYLIVAALVIFGSLDATADTAGRAVMRTAPQKVRLANGLVSIVAEDRTLPLVAVAVVYGVGFGSDPPMRGGLAHFLEHLLVRGSAHAPRQGSDADPIDDIGGFSDARTDADYTVYWAVVPSRALETVLWLFSDRMSFLVPAVTEEILETERRVVLNERRQRVDNSPTARGSDDFYAAMYPSPHPYDHLAFGTEESVGRMTMADVREFYLRHYGPSGATLVIVGDTSIAHAAPLIEKYFAKLRPLAPPAPPVDAARAKDRVSARGAAVPRFAVEGPRPLLRMGWGTAPQFSDDGAALEILAWALDGDTSGPLRRKLDAAGLSSVSADCAHIARGLGSVILCNLAPESIADLPRAEEAVDDLIAELAMESLPDADVARAFWRWHTNKLKATEAVTGRALMMGMYQRYVDDPEYLDKDIARHRSVSADAIRGAVSRWLIPERRSVLTIAPARTP